VTDNVVKCDSFDPLDYKLPTMEAVIQLLQPDNKDIAFTLTDTATDSNFTVTTAADSTSYSAFTRASGSTTSAPIQLILIDNQDAGLTPLAAGLAITSQAGGITNAIDASDPELVNAINIGSNDIAGTNFSVAGGSGNVIAGDVAVNGGDITVSSNIATTLFNTTTTNL
jgi:hypothetical protein